MNVHDEAVIFEPIHRVLFDTDAEGFSDAAAAFWQDMGTQAEAGHTVTVMAGDEARRFTVEGLTIGRLIAAAEEFCGGFIREHGGRLDYIHGDETALALARQPGCCALLLPAMDKSELFYLRHSQRPLPAQELFHRPCE